MRQLLTIFHYELLMQLKSIRFKATCLLAGLIAFGFYSNGVRFQSPPDLKNTVLGFDSSFMMYLIAISFTGLFAIGRVRSSGMHPVLMTKPFPTFALLLAQLLAGLCALLIPLSILFFPAGLLLRWRYGMEFPIPPLLHTLLFFMVPLICCVLALTIWVRTCFKNNLMAIVILGVIFLGCAIFSDRLLTGSGSGQEFGERTHRYVPMLSYFSQTYWRGRMRIFDQPRVTFTRGEDWANWTASLLYCNVFLMLGGYHLRRTEPQRKVLGSYGRHWYHTPTFLRIACDLKIDPNVTWRHHLVLLGMIGVIVMRTLWPMLPDARALMQAAGGGPSVSFSERDFPESKILKVQVLDDTQLMRPERYESTLTISLSGETSGTTAILRPYARYAYDIASIAIDQKPVKHTRSSYYLIDGKELKPYADGRPHAMKIIATRSTVQDEAMMSQSLESTSIRGYYFIERRTTSMGPNGEPINTFDSFVRRPWPVRLTMFKPAAAQFICAPLEPVVYPEGKFTRYEFTTPPELNLLHYKHWIYFALGGDYTVIESPSKRLNFRLAVPKAYADAGRQLMDLSTPVLDEFYTLHRLAPARPVYYISPLDHSENLMMLNEIRRYHYIYRDRSYLSPWEKDRWMEVLKLYEQTLLPRIPITAGGIPTDLGDFFAFAKSNMFKGLNQRLTLERQYEPPEYSPVNAHLDAKAASPLSGKAREECLRVKSDWPVFQMLYLVLGHERWLDMTVRLRGMLLPDGLRDEALRRAAEAAAGESLAWFFDYWIKDGADLPCYKVESATAKSGLDADEKTQYDVQVVVQNLGSGRMPVPLRVLTSKGFAEEKIWIGPGQKATWKVRCKDLPKTVTVDPEGWILTKPYWVEKNKSWVVTAEMNVKID